MILWVQAVFVSVPLSSCSQRVWREQWWLWEYMCGYNQFLWVSLWRWIYSEQWWPQLWWYIWIV